MRKIFFGLIPLALLACLFGSSKLIKPAAEVATVDGRPIKYGAMDSVMVLLRQNSSYGVPPESLKAEALDSLIDKQLIAIRIDSISASLDNEWEFGLQRDENVGEVAKKVLFDKQITGRVTVDSAAIDDYYKNSSDEFKEPETVDAKHILIRRANPDTSGVKSEKKKKELVDKNDLDAKKAAEEIMKMALDGRDWDSLAAAYSEDKSNSSRGGELGYFTRGRMVPEFDSVAFAAKPGQIVGPVSTKFGYHIIKIEDHKTAGTRPLDDDLRDEIKTRLTRDAQKDVANTFMDSLKQAGVYEYNDEVLGTDDKFPPEKWVMVVNKDDTLFYKRYMDALPRYMKWKGLDSLTVDDKKDMLSYLATGLLLTSAARTLGYYNDPEVVKSYDDYTRIEARKRINNLLRDNDYKPTDKEIEEYYYSHIKDYTFERPLWVYHIIFQDSTKAAAVRDSIMDGADFVEMAKRYYPGEPEIREVAYNLDYIGPEDMGHEFYAAANALKVGEISPPVKTKWGYHIIKLISRKEDKTIKQVRPGIISKLKGKRNEQYEAAILDQWKSAADIQVNSKIFNKIEAPEKVVIDINSASEKDQSVK